MIQLLKEVVCLLREISVLLRLLIRFMRARHAKEQLRERWTKQDVIERLKMSESTYKRNVRIGLLKPMRLNGSDEYFDEDIYDAMNESRRRGRV